MLFAVENSAQILPGHVAPQRYRDQGSDPVATGTASTQSSVALLGRGCGVSGVIRNKMPLPKALLCKG